MSRDTQVLHISKYLVLKARGPRLNYNRNNQTLPKPSFQHHLPIFNAQNDYGGVREAVYAHRLCIIFC